MSDFPKLDMKNGLFIQNLNNPVEGALMEWGMPSCMLDFSKELLSQLSPGMLGAFAAGMQEGREAAQNKIADALASFFRDTGWMEVDADTGKIRFLSSSSKFGIDAPWANTLGEIFGTLQVLEQYYGAASDAYLAIEACFDDIDNWLGLLSGEETGSAQLVLDGGPGHSDDPLDPANHSPFQKNRQGEFLIAKLQVSGAIEFANKCTSSLGLIAEVLSDKEREAYATAQEEETRPIFRLVFGPPEAKQGQFLLSKDGLYYDSQAGGLDPVFLAISGIVPAGDKWKYNYDPNLGGKGI